MFSLAMAQVTEEYLQAALDGLRVDILGLINGIQQSDERARHVLGTLQQASQVLKKEFFENVTMVEDRFKGNVEESRRQLAERGQQALLTLSKRPASQMIVVAHGGILTAALGLLVGRDHPLLADAIERPFTRLPALANCSVSELSWPGPQLVRFNETGHLVSG